VCFCPSEFLLLLSNYKDGLERNSVNIPNDRILAAITEYRDIRDTTPAVKDVRLRERVNGRKSVCVGGETGRERVNV
jgi:hypothetical protein